MGLKKPFAILVSASIFQRFIFTPRDQVALIQVFYNFLLQGRTCVSAHQRAPTQVRSYHSYFSCYERNLV